MHSPSAADKLAAFQSRKTCQEAGAGSDSIRPLPLAGSAMLNRKRHLNAEDDAGPLEALPQENGPSDAALAAQAGRGSRWAAEQLIRRYQDRAFAVAFRMSGGDEDQARDATQDAFVKALDGIDRFRGQSNFYTWFYRILVNTCLDARKRKRRWSRLFSIGSRLLGKDGTEASATEAMPDPAASADPMESLEATELRRNLYRVLERLPDRQRTAFELKIFEEMTLSEIARVMKLETGTVKSHLFRATRAVRAALADWAEG